MFTTPLVRQLIKSMAAEPDRWNRSGRLLRREDGIELVVPRSGEGVYARVRMNAPRDITFGRWEGQRLKRAVNAWQHRPL